MLPVQTELLRFINPLPPLAQLFFFPGVVGTRNTWITGLPLVQVDDGSIRYNGGIALVEVYAVQ